MSNEFTVITKPVKYKVIHYVEDDKRSLPILMEALGDRLVVNKDSILIRHKYGWLGIYENEIENGDYILIPEDPNMDIKIYKQKDAIEKYFLILK